MLASHLRNKRKFIECTEVGRPRKLSMEKYGYKNNMKLEEAPSSLDQSKISATSRTNKNLVKSREMQIQEEEISY